MATVAQSVGQRVPPLVAGDRLTREEFLRRWEAAPEIKKAELIGGMVYMPSPVSTEHGDMEGDVGGWLFSYKVATPGTAYGHNATAFLLDDAPQSDINLRILPEHGGKSWVEGDYLHGTPELFAEISRSSASYDLHQKRDLFEAARIPEYIAVLLYEQEIRWHRLVRGKYKLLSPDADGIWRSRIFPGLWLDGKALLEGNMKQVLAKLQEGLDSPEHKAFVDKLARSRQA